MSTFKTSLFFPAREGDQVQCQTQASDPYLLSWSLKPRGSHQLSSDMEEDHIGLSHKKSLP